MWQFEGRPPGWSQSKYELRWDFPMPDGSRFDEPQWRQWRETAKLFIATVMADPPQERKVPRLSTVRSYYHCIRVLINWMVDNEWQELRGLDRPSQRAFIREVAKRKRRGGDGGLRRRTLRSYQELLDMLYMQGLSYAELSVEEPLFDERLSSHQHDRGRLPYTPDEIAIPLVRGALRLIGQPADDVIALNERVDSEGAGALRK